MFYAFIDESGLPKPTGLDAKPVLVAVCIKDDDINEVTHRLYKAEIDWFGEDPMGTRELKGKKLINERTIERKYSNRKGYVEKVLEILEIYNAAIFAVVMENPDFEPLEEKGILPIYYRFLLQRLNYFSLEKSKDILVIFDKKDDKKDRSIADGFKGFLFKHEEGKRFINTVKMPLFVASIVTSFIKFPDLTGNILREFYNRDLTRNKPSNQFEEWLNEIGLRVISRSINFRNGGHTVYGIYQMSKNKFPRPKK